MMITPPKSAMTTPAVGAQTQRSTASEHELDKRYGIRRTTVQRWKHRDSLENCSHAPHRLQTTLNPGQEELAVYLRKQLRLPLDELLAMVRNFIHPPMGRSALHRPLVRQGVDQWPKPSLDSFPGKPSKAYEPRYGHIDEKCLPQMAYEATRRKTVEAARSFPKELAEAAPRVMGTILTDTGKELTDRLFSRRAKYAFRDHEFDLLCDSKGIEHWPTRPRTPQTNGMVERFNGRLQHVVQAHRFNSAEDIR